MPQEGHLFTPFHAEFLQCCILAGQYRSAEKFVRTCPVKGVSSCLSLLYPATAESSIMQSEMFLRYHYYLGVILFACDLYQDAKVAFHMCMTLPGDKLSEIAIAARKKTIVINCLNLCKDEDFLQATFVMMDAKFCAKYCTESNTTFRSSSLSKHLLSIPDGSSLILRKLFDRVSHQYSSLSNSKNLETATSALEIQDHQVQETNVSDYPEETEDSMTHPSMRTSMTHDTDTPPVESQSNYFGLLSYEDVVHTFASGNISLLKVKLQMYNALFVGDGNVGLLKRLVPALQYLLLIRASHVYTVMPLKRLVQFLDLQVNDVHPVRSIESWFMSLTLKQKEIIPYRLDSEKEMISFVSPKSVVYRCEESSKMIAHRIESCIGLAERISRLDGAITTSIKYQHGLLREEAALKQASEEGARSVKDLLT